MDIHRDNLPEHRGKRIHKQPKMVSLRSRIPSGKENFSPSPSCDSNVPWESRSPLPDGFPRVPLQDITDILSPVKAEGEAQGDENAGQSEHKRKKTKKGSFNVPLPVDSRTSEPLKSRWDGLAQCLTVGEAANEETQIQLKGQTAKAEEESVKAEDTEVGAARSKGAGAEMGPNATEEGNTREQKGRRHPPPSNRGLTDSKGRSNVLKLR